MSFLYILAMLLLFSLSIFVHELGHFLAARALGLAADVFSIGMGKALWKRKIGATTWQIGWLPFGGYVALPQMDPNSFLEGSGASRLKSASPSESESIRISDPDSDPDAAAKSRILPRVAPWRKIVVSVAGAFGNLVFALLLATVVWIVGKPSSLQEQNSRIGYVVADGPAAAAGLVVGDEIVAVDGQPVRNWVDISEKAALGASDTVALRVRSAAGEEREVALETEKASVGIRLLPGVEGMDLCWVASVYPNSGAEAAGLQPGDLLLRFAGETIFSRAHLGGLVEAAAGRPALLEFRRGEETLSATVASRYDEGLKRHLIGIGFNTIGDLDFAARVHPTPWAQVRSHAASIFSFLRALVSPATSGAAAGAVGGPVLILLMLWLMLKSSFILGVWFTGFLNVNLAIINLLPVPILDGGHVVMNFWEMIFRRPAPPKLVNALANLFAVLFIALFLLLTFRDSVRHLVPPVQRWIAGEKAVADAPAVFDEKP